MMKMKMMMRMYSSTNAKNLPEIQDPTKRVLKIMMSSPKVGLEQSLDAIGIWVSPESSERVLERFENAGMLAYRFFEWARKQHHHHRRHYTHTIKAHHSMIAALAKIRQYKLVWNLVASMRSNSTLNLETFCLIIRKYARAHKFDEAIYTFSVMDKFGIPQNLAAFNSLLSALCKSKNVRKAQELFDEMGDRYLPDSKTYSILLDGWGRAPNLPKMREVFKEMLDRGSHPDIVTYGIMVDALCKAGQVEEAVNVIYDMRSKGCPPTTFIYSALVHTYGTERRIEDAVSTFLQMERDGVKPDVVVYNALITAFCKGSKFKNAFMVLGDMEDKGVPPNSRTWNIILNSLIGAERNDLAFRAFRRMVKFCEPDSDTYTMMVKMFFESNRPEMALKVWRYMGSKGFVPSMHTFSVLINGFCEMGEARQACVFMEEMIERGIRPSGSTFGKLRQMLLKEGRKDVLEFLTVKMNDLADEPLGD